jgi:metal-sulfur cluster biosynthetic enzyme
MHLISVFWLIYKRKSGCELADLMDKQVIEALTVIKNTVQVMQSLQNTIDTAKMNLKISMNWF